MRAHDIPTLLRKGKIKVVVIGLGRIGLPTAALFAHAGARVTGIDIRKEVVRETNAGKCKLVDEPGLGDIVRESARNGRLRAITETDEAIPAAHFFIVCVPTPVDETKTPDYSSVRKALRTVGKSLRKGCVVIVESTVGPGIVEDVVRPIIESESGLKAGKDFGLVSCPERSDPGNILQNMKSLPRIVGGLDPASTELVSALYESAFGVKAIKVRDPKTANAVKLTENLFRDVNIALANEFALLFEKLGIDAIEVINACASKYNFMPHYPGAGVGGPCLVSDEFVFLVDSMGLRATRIGDYVRLLVDEKRANVVTEGQMRFVMPKEDVLALSFDGRCSLFKKVQWFSIRPYTGTVKRLRLTTNRYLTVTPDHPMLVKTPRGIDIKHADELQIGDEIPLSPGYVPPYISEDPLDLIDELEESGQIPLSKVKVKPTTGRLRDHIRQVGSGLRSINTPPTKRHDYYRWNYLPLDTYLKVQDQGAFPFDRESLALYTARGHTSRVPAVMKTNEDFWRFIGYYASEGCLYSETTRRGTRDRIKVSFGAHEATLIDDCRRILTQWGICPSEKVRNGSHSLAFSSSVFGFLLRGVLGAGRDSYSKRIPPQLFFSSRRNIAAFLQGLFRGDGWLEESDGSTRKSVILGFATTSPELFQGVLLLLQVFGITPTCREITTRKATVPAQALTIARYQDLLTVQQDIGGLPGLEASLQSYYHTTKRSTVFVDYGSYKTAFVRCTDDLDYSGEVYNLEIKDAHTFVTSYGITTHNCLPSNSYYLISEGLRAGNIPYIIRMAREINDRMPDHVVELVGEALNDAGKTIKGSRIAVLGVAYKPNVKDVQLTPLERVVSRLKEMGADVQIYDPMFKGERVLGLVAKPSLEAAVKRADCIVMGTAHDEFKRLDLEELSRLVRMRAGFVDARNVVVPTAAVKAGFAFRGVGRRP